MTFFMMGLLFFELKYNHPDNPPDCDQVRTEILAFQDCLRHRPGCLVDVAGFIRYHELKNREELLCFDNEETSNE